MSTSGDGARHEDRATTILERMGYMLAAEAKRVPIWKDGRVIASKPVDIVPAKGGGTADGLYIHPLRRVLVLQVTTHDRTGGSNVSARRAKLRAVMPLLPQQHVEAQLWAWERDERHYRVYRAEEDFAENDWRISIKDTAFPWERPIEPMKQVTI